MDKSPATQNQSIESKRSKKWAWVMLAAIIAGAVFAANAHMLYVAMTSQPDCIHIAKTEEGSSQSFRAAKPSC